MMIKSVRSYKKTFLIGEELYVSLVSIDKKDDAYIITLPNGMVIQFGEGDMSNQLAYLFYESVVEEISESLDVLPKHYAFEYEHIEPIILDEERSAFLAGIKEFSNLQKIVSYIDHFHDDIQLVEDKL